MTRSRLTRWVLLPIAITLVVASVVVAASAWNGGPSSRPRLHAVNTSLVSFPEAQSQLTPVCEPARQCFIYGSAGGGPNEPPNVEIPILLSWRPGDTVPLRVHIPRFNGAVDGILCLPNGLCTLQISYWLGNHTVWAGKGVMVGQAVSRPAIFVSSGSLRTWRPVRTPSSYFNGTVCVTTQRCVALLPHIAATTSDAGRHWSLTKLPPDFTVDLGSTSGANPIWCISSSTCLTLGTGASGKPLFLRTVDAGTRWTTDPVPALRYNETVTCNNGTCVVQDATVALTADDGAVWSTVALPRHPGLYGATCATRVACVASDGDGRPYWTDDAGARWHAAAIQPLHDEQGSATFACASASDCVAWRQDGVNNSYLYASSDGGRTWTPVIVPADVTFSSSACDALQVCAVLGQNEEAQNPTVVGGRSQWTSLLDVANVRSGANWWGRQSTTDSQYNAVACTRTWCAVAGARFDPALGRNVGLLRWGSSPTAAWRSAPLPANVSELDSIACTSARCVAGGSTASGRYVLLRSFGKGRTWRTTFVPRGSGTVRVASCIRRRCIALVSPINQDFSGRTVVLISTDGGLLWAKAPRERANGLYGTDVNSLACIAPDKCFATAWAGINANFLLASTDGGVTWNGQVPGVSPTSPISCDHAGCIVGIGVSTGHGPGGALLYYSLASSAWRSVTGLIGGQADSIACTSLTRCVVGVFDGSGIATQLIWTRPKAHLGRARDVESMARPAPR